MSNRFLTKFTVNRRAVTPPEIARYQQMEEQCKKECGDHAKTGYHSLSCPFVRSHVNGNNEEYQGG